MVVSPLVFWKRISLLGGKNNGPASRAFATVINFARDRTIARHRVEKTLLAPRSVSTSSRLAFCPISLRFERYMHQVVASLIRQAGSPT